MGKNFTKKEKQMIERNIENSKYWLSRRIDNINTGLNLMGVYAEINSNNQNQLDFYTLDGHYIASKIIGYTRDYVSEGFGKYPDAKFINYDRVYSFDVFNIDDYSDRYLFRTHSNSESGIGYTLEMFFNSFDTLRDMNISSYHAKDDCIIKEFDIGNHSIRAKIDNAFGPSGNYVDGEEREIWFDSKKPLLFMTEAVWPKQGEMHREIGSGSLAKGAISSNNHLFSHIPDEQMRELMLNITRHPRNKELINYVLNEYEKMIPGITKFIDENFHMYGDIINQEYVSNERTDVMIDNTIMERCNFENIKDAKARTLGKK